MASIDIRDEDIGLIDTIIVADEGAGLLVFNEGDPFIEDDMGERILIVGKQNAKNLIKAIQKAIELGWFEQ